MLLYLADQRVDQLRTLLGATAHVPQLIDFHQAWAWQGLIISQVDRRTLGDKTALLALACGLLPRILEVFELRLQKVLDTSLTKLSR